MKTFAKAQANKQANEQSWFRVANLKPKLRDHISVHRQEYRGQTWYTYRDRARNSFHRFSRDAHAIIALMDGKRSVQQIWERLQTTQDQSASVDKTELIQLLEQLHKAELIQSNLKANCDALYQRSNAQHPSQLKRVLRNPISLRISLLDPERMLNRSQTLIRHLFSWPVFAAWLTVTLFAVILALAYLPELAAAANRQLLQPKNLLLLAMIYPLVKLVHEFGHAFAVKRWGGEVHEMGVLLLLFFPIPYVDASAASAFPGKYQRMAVGAAGILVEMLLAALALFAWLLAEPGLIRDIAFNTMLICGISTLLFNGNPLLRYDGYYVFSDAIEIPNLAGKSRRYLVSLLEHFLLGNVQATTEATAAGEKKWLLAYAPLSVAYRLVVLALIVLVVTDIAFVLGMLLAALFIFHQLLVPAYNLAKRLWRTQDLPRGRAAAISGMLLVPIMYLIFLAPFPLFTLAQGVVWLPNDARLSAQTDGFVSKVLVAPNSVVQRGDLILELEDPLLRTNRKIVEAQILDLENQYKASWSLNRVQGNILLDEIESLRARLAQLREREQALLVRSNTTGKFVIPDTRELQGRYLKKGEVIGYVVDPAAATARVAIPESKMGYLAASDDASVLFAGNTDQPVTTHINRIIPEATYRLPSPALGRAGGGPLAIDPLDTTQTRTLEKIFEVELALPASAESAFIGRRLFVRFDHGSQTLAEQGLHSLRQVFLRRFTF